MKFNKEKGFTLIELLAVIVVLAIILLIATPIILNVIDDARKGSFKSSAGYLVKAAENKYMKNQMNSKREDIVVTYVDGKLISTYNLDYKGEKPKNGTIVVRQDGKVGIAIDNGKWCAIKKYNEEEINLIKLENDNCKLSEVLEIPEVVSGFNEKKGVNKPQLVTGMTPIKWDENNNEIETNEADPEWYDYSNKKWANVITKDAEGNITGYFIWIPRYAYKITSGYHSNTSGTIDIKFLKERTNEPTDGTIIETSGYVAGVKDTSMHYFLHPSFQFGEEETLGFWVAKFEASGTKSDIKILPNVASLRSMTINEQYEAAFNLKNNIKYGWESNVVDTHMASNSEWGAVAYLSISNYGKAEVVTPNLTNYNTGGGNYITNTGQSTTGNVTGVYDMSGGSYEYVASYCGAGTAHGSSIVSALEKYKITYLCDDFDGSSNMYGDAMYETGLLNGMWNKEMVIYPSGGAAFFRRGRGTVVSNSGIFSISRHTGAATTYDSFRVVVNIKD